MKSLIALAAAAAVGAVAAPASAESLPPLTPISYNASIAYTGISSTPVDLGAVTLRAGADFGQYFGVEGEGSFGVSDETTAVSGVKAKFHLNDEYAAYGVVRFPIFKNAAFFARGGYGHSDVKATANVGAISVSQTAGVDSWNYGAGLEYLVDGKNGIRLDYTRFDFQDRGFRDADTWSVGYVRKF